MFILGNGFANGISEKVVAAVGNALDVVRSANVHPDGVFVEIGRQGVDALLEFFCGP